MMMSEDEFEIISIWTSSFLEEIEKKSFSRKNGYERPQSQPYTVVFGRTAHNKLQNVHCNEGGNHNAIRRNSCVMSSAAIHNEKYMMQQRNQHGDLRKSTSSTTASTSASPVQSQNSKMKGRQIMSSKHDFDKAQEKRKRQLKYALEVKTSQKNAISLQISSITRIVVQSFRKLIDCERCALFLMDHKTNELCFKPVGNEHDTDPREIRFPASAGVAGWVATKGQALNIRNAYQDERFNPEIDKQTNFRTRAILCTPVFSSKGHLFGVIQMVNKKKGDYWTITSMAKKKKSDAKHHGYESCFEPFSEEDERLLHRCCVQVSRALEPFLEPTNIPESNHNLSSESDGSKSCNNSLNALIANEAKKNRRSSITSCRRDSNISIKTEASLRRERRRSSVGSLIQFVNAETGNSHSGHTATEGMFGRDAGVSEAIRRFEFRSAAGPQMSAKGQLKSNPDRLIAATKRKRMVDYFIQQKDRSK